MKTNAGSCQLCRINVADKKNSHLIPKFITKNLFPTTGRRYALAINGDGTTREWQDTPKEDHLLCSACETRIGNVESYFARPISRLHNFTKYPSEFSLEKIGLSKGIKCLKMNPGLFKLFISSIVWRLSVSKHFTFGAFKLHRQFEEDLRIFLHDNLPLKESQLSSLDFNNILAPSYHYYLVKPKVRTNPPGGLLAGASNEHTHMIGLADFFLILAEDDQYITPLLRPFSNQLTSIVTIGVGENSSFLDLSEVIIYKTLNQNKGEVK